MSGTEHSAADIYGTILHSFVLGVLRLWEAEAAAARLNLALLEFHQKGAASVEENAYADSLGNLARIQYSSFDSLVYVTNVSHLVYATTLLDTFLNDTTLFMFLMFPQAMGKNQQVPLATLLAHGSRNQVVTDTAVRRAREVSYLPFGARVAFLRDTFGLPIVLSDRVAQALEHYPSVRNSAVHDQGVFELSLDDGGRLVSKQKACFRHPTQVRDQDIRKAIETSSAIACTIATSIMTQVLKTPDHASLRALLRGTTADHGQTQGRSLSSDA